MPPPARISGQRQAVRRSAERRPIRARRAERCPALVPDVRAPPALAAEQRFPANSVSSCAARHRPARGPPPRSGRGRSAPSAIFTAIALPSGRAATWTPLKPSLASSLRHGPHQRAATSRPDPEAISACSRIASATRPRGAWDGGDDAGGGAGETVQGRSRTGARRSQSTVTRATRCPVGILDDLGDRLLERVARVEVVVQGPAVEHAGVCMAACLPEQFWASRDGERR